MGRPEARREYRQRPTRLHSVGARPEEEQQTTAARRHRDGEKSQGGCLWEGGKRTNYLLLAANPCWPGSARGTVERTEGGAD
ncbi:hypothetical protein NDU88_005660 [Pleurodeles waltl]|uniref:Uncharacterized protein n=1 Tax=Pleurodeles waltl TaxID=8319 RepID=A0AAV7MYQ7_PLEWA|nr:hypothetical protein NDU88_005660 [Pleurodeles waltl]